MKCPICNSIMRDYKSNFSEDIPRVQCPVCKLVVPKEDTEVEDNGRIADGYYNILNAGDRHIIRIKNEGSIYNATLYYREPLAEDTYRVIISDLLISEDLRYKMIRNPSIQNIKVLY